MPIIYYLLHNTTLQKYFANWQSFLKLMQDIFHITLWQELLQLWTTTATKCTLPHRFTRILTFYKSASSSSWHLMNVSIFKYLYMSLKSCTSCTVSWSIRLLWNVAHGSNQCTVYSYQRGKVLSKVWPISFFIFCFCLNLKCVVKHHVTCLVRVTQAAWNDSTKT